MKRYSALLMGVLLASRAKAEEAKSLLPCRPTVACTAELGPEGTLQLELGYLHRALAVLRGGSVNPPRQSLVRMDQEGQEGRNDSYPTHRRERRW